MKVNTQATVVKADREKLSALAAAQHGFPGAVMAGAFKAALPAVCAKLMASAGITNPNVRVTFQGTRAFATYSAIHTNSYGGGRTHVNATLNLPALDVGRQMPRAEANRWLGYGLHEMLHVVLTPRQEWDAYCKTASPFRRVLMNAVEDARIEHAGMKRGICAGFANVGTALLANLLATAPKEYNPNTPQGFPFAVAVILRDYGGEGQRALEARLTPRIRKVMDEAIRLFDGVNPLTSTFAESCVIADKIADMLKDMANAEQPDQPVGPEGKPCEEGQPGKEKGKGKEKSKGKDEDNEDDEDGDDADSEGGDASDDEDGDFGDEGDDEGDGEGESQGDDGEGDGEGDPAEGDDGEGKGKSKGGAGDEGDEGEAEGGDGEGKADVNEGDHSTREGDGDNDGQGGGGVHERGGDKRAKSEAPQPAGHDVEDFAKLDEVKAGDMVQVEPTLEIEKSKVEKDSGADIGDCQFRNDAFSESDESGTFSQTVLRQARVAGVRSQLRRLLERTDRMGEARGLPRGKLVSSQLARTATGDANVFSRRWELEGEDAAVSIVIDMSGSMSAIATQAQRITGHEAENSRLGVAIKTALVIADALQQTNGVKVEVLGFPGRLDYENLGNTSVGNSHSGDAIEEYKKGGASAFNIKAGIGMTVVKGFNDRMNVMYRRALNAAYHAGGGTPDLEALDGAAKRLMKVQAEKKILFMICDGDGASASEFRAHVDMLYAKHRILCIGLGIGCNGNFPKRFKYGAVVQGGKRLTEDCLTTLVNSIVKDRA